MQCLVRDIVSGVYREGDQLPSEWDLARVYKVSQGTIRRAINGLAKDRWLIREQGKGTFVSAAPDEWLMGGVAYLGEWDTAPNLSEPEIISVVASRASDSIAHALSLRRASPLLHVRQRWSIEGMPFALDDVFLPWSMVHGVDMRFLKEHGGIYRSLFLRGIRPVSTHAQYRAVLASDEDVHYLKVSIQEPLLEMIVVNRDLQNVPMEWRVRRLSTKHFALSIKNPD
jgi:GntR family transcriptional regulator